MSENYTRDKGWKPTTNLQLKTKENYPALSNNKKLYTGKLYSPMYNENKLWGGAITTNTPVLHYVYKINTGPGSYS